MLNTKIETNDYMFMSVHVPVYTIYRSVFIPSMPLCLVDNGMLSSGPCESLKAGLRHLQEKTQHRAPLHPASCYRLQFRFGCRDCPSLSGAMDALSQRLDELESRLALVESAPGAFWPHKSL